MSHSALPYRPDVDGLRAVAVMSVVGYHAFPGKVAGGFIGVDIFFVISGFLITSILLAQLAEGTFSLRDFYARRVLRIFPAALIVFVACLAAGWYLLLPDEFSRLGKHVAGGAAFVSNLILRSESGYFDTAAESKPLLHLWSLGIEEQYYLVWPLLAYFLFTRRWSVSLMIAGLVAISFAFNAYWVHARDPANAFYLPLARVWELLTGAALAHVGARGHALRAARAQALSLLGCLLIAGGLLFIDRQSAFPGYWALLPTFGAALLILGGPSAFVNRHVLSSRFAVWVGKISYPLYLWHWPALVYVKLSATDGFTRELRLLAVGVSVALAHLTYVLLETPLRSGARKPQKAAVLALAMVVLAAGGLLTWQGAVHPRSNDPALVDLVSGVEDWAYPDGFEKLTRDGVRFNVLPGGTDRTTVFWGDSHMEQYGPAVVAQAKRQQNPVNAVVFSTDSACLPIPSVDSNYPNRDDCRIRRETTLKMLREPQVESVVITSCWNCFFSGSSYAMRSTPRRDNYFFIRGTEAIGLGTAEGRALALASLEGLLRELAAARKRVYLILDNPLSEAFDPTGFVTGSRLRGLAARKVTPSIEIPAAQEEQRQNMAALARRAGAVVLDPSSTLCDRMTCRRLSGGRPIYRDAHHLLPFYVRAESGLLVETLLPSSNLKRQGP